MRANDCRTPTPPPVPTTILTYPSDQLSDLEKRGAPMLPKRPSQFVGPAREQMWNSRGPWMFVGEISHRVLNEYTLAICSLSLVASASPSQVARDAISMAIRRLRDYAAVHSALQAPLPAGSLDLADYLWAICTAMVRATLEERDIRLTLVEQSVLLDARRCWCVGLIVSELITNATRHGFRDDRGGAIVVQLSDGERTGILPCFGQWPSRLRRQTGPGQRHSVFPCR